MRSFWPVGEAAQADYEMLREAALDDMATVGVTAARFWLRGLAGLVAWPAAEPVFSARLRGGQRPAWSPHSDPRLEALAAGYALLLAPRFEEALTVMEARA